MHPEISKTLRELQKAQQEAARLARRLKRINAHKMPMYWMLPPRAEQYAQQLVGILQESTHELQQPIKHP